LSYDISLEADLGGPEPVELAVLPHLNYTSNCSHMWTQAGAPLAEFDGRTARSCLPMLSVAIFELTSYPEKYDEMNPSNGWGSRETLVPKLQELHAAFRAAPDAIVRVGR
jgi:hypothetical protein